MVGVDLRCGAGGLVAQQAQQRVLLQDSAGVTGLAWEYPCLGVSLARGQLAVFNAEAAMAQHAQRLGGTAGPAHRSRGAGARGQGAGAGGWRGKGCEPWVKWLSLPGSSGSQAGASCLAMGEQWLAAGCESGSVATWDFSGALEADRAAAALRRRRQERKRGAQGQGRGRDRTGHSETAALI